MEIAYSVLSVTSEQLVGWNIRYCYRLHYCQHTPFAALLLYLHPSSFCRNDPVLSSGSFNFNVILSKIAVWYFQYRHPC